MTTVKLNVAPNAGQRTSLIRRSINPRAVNCVNAMLELDEKLEEFHAKNAVDTLTFGETIPFGFYKLLDGEHINRVVIKSSARVDGKPIIFFVDKMTWTYESNISNIRCKMVSPKFDG